MPSILDIAASTAVKNGPGTLVTLTVTTAGSTVGYASDAAVVPAVPVLSETAGGSISPTTYYARIAYTDANNAVLGTLSAESSLAVDASNLLVVASPAAYTGAVGWIPYVSTTTGTESAQVTTPITIGTSWTEPTTGLISGASVDATLITAIPNTVGIYELIWPCFNGITIVPGTSQVVSVSYE